MTLTLEHKKLIHAACMDKVRQQIVDAEAMIKDAEDAIRNDTKSSAGDKYETGREMATQQKVKAAGRLAEAQGLKTELERIDPTAARSEISPGTLVQLSNGTFFISVGLGKIQTDNLDIYAISLNSPIGKVLAGGKTGEELPFRGQKLRVIQMC